MNNSIGGQEVMLRDGNGLKFIRDLEKDLPITPFFNYQWLKELCVDHISGFQCGTVLSGIKYVVQKKVVKRTTLKKHQALQGIHVYDKRIVNWSKDGVGREQT